MLRENIHYSLELEKTVLGACMLEQNAFGRLYKLIGGEMFYLPDHRVVFEAIGDLWASNEPTDIISVYLKLGSKGIQTLNNYSAAYYVTSLIQHVTSTASLEYHSAILREMYINREMLILTNSGLGKMDGTEAIDSISQKLQKLKEKVVIDDFVGIDELVVNLYKHMDEVKDKDLSGITTGFTRLDSLTGGFQNGGMYIVGARPSVGKSAFMGKMVYMAAQRNHKVGIISLEMTDNQIAARISSLATDIEYWRIYRSRLADEQQTELFYRKTHEVSELPIVISDKTGVDISDIKAKVARLKKRNRIDILFIDYLQLLETDDQDRNINREQQVSRISRGIKLLAKDYNIPIIVLAQLNRISETTADKKPRLHNLRESGSLEQDADGVIFLHRDWMSGIKENENGQSTESEADIIIAKWRDGEVTEYKIGFDGAKMKFYEIGEEVRNSLYF